MAVKTQVRGPAPGAVAPRSALDAPAEVAFRSLIRTFGMLERVMLPHFARLGVSASQWGVLRTLHRAESNGNGGLRLTDLSERLLVRPPSVTGVVARLERDGLVTRDPSLTDQRAKTVSLTAAGRQLMRRVLDAHGEQVSKVMGGLGSEGCRQLQELLERLEWHLGGVLDADNEGGAGLRSGSARRPGRAGATVPQSGGRTNGAHIESLRTRNDNRPG
jgi:DNA-binding MarR family transcriptional regulator